MASPCSPCTAWSWSTRAQSRSRRRSERPRASAPKGERTTSYEDIPSQRVADAIKSCGGSEMPARLLETAKQACGEGLVTAGEYERLEREPA